ncbi:hypothetical protein [Paraburkholderia acidipaludis]|uniref:hypothetical protein n=1 Tax=Paraburkholderia acidipaludis TaxID=660537 RepID=UPI0004846BC7|nr:hypothetical protein [Paraburkholderia acidipaludis]
MTDKKDNARSMRAAPQQRFRPAPGEGSPWFFWRKKPLPVIVLAPKFDLYMAVLNPGIAPA